MNSRAWVRWLLVLPGATALGIFFATQTYMSYRYSGGQAHFGVILKFNLGQWYVWALLAPALVWLSRKFRLGRGTWLKSSAMLLPASMVFVLVHWMVTGLIAWVLLGYHGFPGIVFTIHSDLLTFWGIVAASHGYDYYRRYRQGELRSSKLAAQLAEAQLQALRMQLHPHFLFNTLNAIASLIHSDPEAADRMLAQLSDLLRLTLENVGVQEVPLAQELEFLEKYLEIERTRFADRLEVRMEIAPETLAARMPYLILQPLVENAIRHGIAPRAAAGRVFISARRLNGRLEIAICDNGPGVRADVGRNGRSGVGLASTRARLEQLYGSEHFFDLHNAEEGGLVVTLAIPYRTAAAEPRSRQMDGKP